MCSNPIDDESRFCAIIDAAIESGEVESYKAYTKETKASKTKRRKAAEKEAKEAEEYAKELGVHEAIFGKGPVDEDKEPGTEGKKKSSGRKVKSTKVSKEPDISGLEALIKSRNSNRMDDLVSSLEAKYGGKPSKKGGKRTQMEEPDEEAFQNARARLDGRKTSKRSKRS